MGLMRLFALSGRKGEACCQYERFQEPLRRQFGTEPGVAARRPQEESVAGHFPPSPPSAIRAPESDRPIGEASAAGSHNLPTPRTSLVGRERELVRVKRELAMTRLLTLTGAAGSGKTRLALEVAGDLVEAYPNGVRLVELAPLSEGALVPQAVAKAVAVAEQPGRQPIEALVDALREKKLLVVLDNCEHLVDAAAQLADALLYSCPRLRVVATSREALGIEGEFVWRVDPLSAPDAHRDADRAPAAEELARYDAVRLFVERARLRSPHFELRAENAGAVAQICRRLEGIPLALELAAARVGTLSVDQISQRLEDSLKLLRSDSRTAAPRQRSLRATSNWSHNLLSAKERVLLRRLSAFADGWSLEVAEAVGSSDGIKEGDVLELLSNLVNKSLVVAEVRAGDVRRYRLLEPVRQYARERLEASGEADDVRRRHAEFFLALVEEAEPELTGAPQQDWPEWLEAEHDNLRAALSWSLENEPETVLRLAGPLARLWKMRARFLEGSGWLEAALRQMISCRPEEAMVGAFSARVLAPKAVRQTAQEYVRLGSSSQQREAPSSVAVQPSLRAHLFGRFEVLCDDEVITLDPNSKALAILKYLLVNRARPVSQDHLMGWLWPEANLKRAKWSLNSAIHSLRKLLRDSPSPAAVNYILLEERFYRLCSDVQVITDVDEFDARYEEGRRLAKEGRRGEAAAEYEKGIALYRGDYLVEDLYEDWTMVERERLIDAYIDMLSRLAVYYYETGRCQESIRACYRILEKDRCCEEGYWLLMCCYARLGLRGRALRQYRLCERILRQEYGRAPSPEIEALHENLLSGHH